MGPYDSAGEPSRQAVDGAEEDHSDVPTYSFSSSVPDQDIFTVGSIGQGWVVNNASQFIEDPPTGQLLLQEDPIYARQACQDVSGGYQTNPSFEYHHPPQHAPHIERDERYDESVPHNNPVNGVTGMHSTASSSSSFSLGLRPLLPAPSQLPDMTSWSFAPPGQLSNESLPHSVPAQHPSDAQMSSPLMALVHADHGPSEPDPIKLSAEKTEDIKALLLQWSWYTESNEEPTVKPDDPFVTQGLILSTDKSRFNAFVSSNPHGGKRYCRIKHDVRQKNEVVECTFSAKHPKDTIAHVCEYLNYKPYKCKGTKWHLECDSTYPTNERRNDHYAKKKKGPDALEDCGECGASITARNLPRHIETLHNTNQPEYS